MEKEKLSLWERANQWLRNSITMRLITIGVLILLLLIPVSMVRDLIREREDRQWSAIQEVSEKWGHAQTSQRFGADGSLLYLRQGL
jgi:inner membrane protein